MDGSAKEAPIQIRVDKIDKWTSSKGMDNAASESVLLLMEFCAPNCLQLDLREAASIN